VTKKFGTARTRRACQPVFRIDARDGTPPRCLHRPGTTRQPFLLLDAWTARQRFACIDARMHSIPALTPKRDETIDEHPAMRASAA